MIDFIFDNQAVLSSSLCLGLPNPSGMA